MSAPYFFQLIGHVYLAAHTAHDQESASSALKSAGFGKDRIDAGVKLADRAEELLERMIKTSPDNKTLGHNIHSAVMEVEMWLQTVKMRLKKAKFDHDTIESALGHDLHAHEHTVSAIAQALRAIGTLRALDEQEVARLGTLQSVRDLIIRGNTLLKKLYKVADEQVTPSQLMPRDQPIFKEFDRVNQEMSAWIQELDRATAASKTSHIKALGLIGYLPFGAGLPVGGTAFNVTLHERAITTAPDPKATVKTSGWSVGRQGNRENLGNGWLTSEFGSAMGD